MSVSEVMALQSACTLANFTSPGLIVPRLRGLNAAAAIQELSGALQQEGRVADLLQFYQSAINREYLSNTVTEPGWAMPHALVNGLSEPCFALGRWAAPVVWMKSDRRLVSLVFLFAVPETDARAYMILVSGFARLAKESRLLDQLIAAQDTFQILDVLRQVKLSSHSPPITK
jgi:mannitol/fructose-specific phosphotransferase system IIA component (Ntr-type)